MNEIIQLNSVDVYNKMYGLKTLHPLVSVVDLRKATRVVNHVKMNYGVYALFLKNGTNCTLKYGRRYYDYQEGTIVSFAPGQLVGVDSDEDEISPDCAIRLPGAPIRERLPPIAAANTSGIKSLDLEYPDFAAIPITTGIKTAAVPVLESTPLINPTIIMIAMISCLSVLAKCVTTPPILFAIPVSNNAPPTINIATNKMTLLSINPANAVFQSNTPVTTRPTQMIMDVTPSGIFSHTNITKISGTFHPL